VILSKQAGSFIQELPNFMMSLFSVLGILAAIMYNFILFLIQIVLICSMIIYALKLGKQAIGSFLPLLAVCMNLFVIKQSTLLGLEVTCSEGLAVGYILGFNLMQEFYGKEAARKTIWLTFFCTAAFMVLSQLHLLFVPNSFDNSQSHFVALFKFMPRLVIASLLCFLVVQFFDLTFFAYLKKRFQGKYLTSRIFTSLVVSQALDTVLFSFLGLYGIVEEIFHVMLFSFLIKVLVIIFSTPFITFAKRIVAREQVSV